MAYCLSVANLDRDNLTINQGILPYLVTVARNYQIRYFFTIIGNSTNPANATTCYNLV